MSESATSAPRKDAENVPESELSAPRWSVISFERRERSGLTYSDALATLAELETRGIPGLCIVTDEAAERLKSQE